MSTGALAQPAPTTQVLFENVRVFDGKADALSAPTSPSWPVAGAR
jgi:hypothetical protein